MVVDKDTNEHWWMVGIYASTEDSIRKQQWKAIEEKKREWGDKWVLVDDFNDICSRGEKWGGRERSEGSFRDFNSFISRNELVDIGYERVPWTWSNTWEGKGDTNPVQKRVKRRFYFDQRWAKDNTSDVVIKKAWGKDQHGSRMFKVVRRIKECRIAFIEWNRTVKGNTRAVIQELKGHLKALREKEELSDKGAIANLKLQLSKAHKDEELYWSQKSRSRWLKEGDKNTAYFHLSVMAKRKRNRINMLQKANGEWCRGEQEVVEELNKHYKDLFTSTEPIEFDDVLQDIPRTISHLMNEQLIKPVDEKEIKHATFSMFPNTVPGVDGRQILDNVMIAHEILHFLKNKRTGKVGFMTIKLDMSKAYDRVEWKYLGRIMMHMGFCPIFVQWIMACISSVSYSFNLNGQKVGFIKPARGIRQGDPLSPYLFILYTKGFSNLITKAVDRKILTGIKVSKDSPTVSHLFFADDSLLCCKASKKEALKIKNIIQQYGQASGQVVNFEKSAMFFAKNTPIRIRKEVSKVLDNMREAQSGKYLGLPMTIGRAKKQVFGYLKDKINSKLQGWKHKMLSQWGKEDDINFS
ncbi:uncharacterized protein LOC113766368 [Coffea eugenioides]|uniref:uncharacterized protein LOC113755751 n=1 Tax=Coffea eugenioides TaxID=49369 RepID=UPI000F614C13|nr:uncharacterized protein LOC113755751 [Coffea eugenioides]XP_027166369.1 uncharacterized protein LOC113766368 [Coffea eugenioides]